MKVAQRRLKHLTVGSAQYGLNISSDEYQESGVRLLRTSDIDDSGKLSQASPVHVDPLIATGAPLEAGDLLLSRSGTVGRAFRVPRSILPVTHAGYLVRFRPAADADPRFLEWTMRSQGFVDQVSLVGIQSTITNVNAQKYASMLLPAPPLPIQRRIANFLDQETERIDALIDKKRRLIDLLEEKRTATITHAVTKGLNPAVPTKDSGIPWIGETPEHWDRCRLKHALTRLIDTEHKTVHFVENGDYLVVRTSDVRSGRLLVEQARRTDKDGYREWTRRGRPEPGDVMLAREAPAGEACLVPPDTPLCLGQRMVLITPDPGRLLDQFLVYSIYSEAVKVFIMLASQGSTVVHLNMADIPEIPLALPDVTEQRRIISYLGDQVQRSENLVELLARQLSLLSEYREALITAAVTGEIDVDTFDNDRHLERTTP